MTPEQREEDLRKKEMEERWEMEFGPEISPRRKLLSALVIIGGVVGIILLTLLSIPE